MYAIEADEAKRLVVISPVGRVTKEEMQGAAKRAREMIKDFRPGFRLLADFRWLESMDSAGGQYIADIMDAMTEKQVMEVIRIVPDPHKDIGLNILSQFHYDPKVRITTYTTLADALAGMTPA
ncbi:MAG TPA: hypothetical protein VFQ78_02405 [Candidatus Udaeobacter sp.]|nr:hypothetical protein [Candidatus Udaeobacter sp.]